ncbi:hypothetical protein K440DRAFT_460 [Wilcoxina mikolae CBS 423.85]|nr:hypothetical protein K440DRAFT_460 [Wilcoxina mikolae CBS 423.85]
MLVTVLVRAMVAAVSVLELVLIRLELLHVHNPLSCGSHEQPVPLIGTLICTLPEVVLVVSTIVAWRMIDLLRWLHGIMTRRCGLLTVRWYRLIMGRYDGFRSGQLDGLLTVPRSRLTSARYCGLSSVWPDGLWLRVVVPMDLLPLWRLNTYNSQPYGRSSTNGTLSSCMSASRRGESRGRNECRGSCQNR